jgi:hypothetical protein
VVDRVMARKFIANANVPLAFVGHETRLARGDLDDYRSQSSCCYLWNVYRANSTTALDKRHNDLLFGGFLYVSSVSRRAANMRFVRLDNLTLATDWIWISGLHCFANTMCHEPCGFVRNAKFAVKLVRTSALLAGIKLMRRIEPFVERHMARLKHGANGHTERLLTFVALVDAGARALAFKLRDAIRIGIATMGAERTLRPQELFKMLAGLVLVAVYWIGDVHGLPLSTKPSYHALHSTSST